MMGKFYMKHETVDPICNVRKVNTHFKLFDYYTDVKEVLPCIHLGIACMIISILL